MFAQQSSSSCRTVTSSYSFQLQIGAELPIQLMMRLTEKEGHFHYDNTNGSFVESKMTSSSEEFYVNGMLMGANSSAAVTTVTNLGIAQSRSQMQYTPTSFDAVSRFYSVVFMAASSLESRITQSLSITPEHIVVDGSQRFTFSSGH